MRFSSYFANAIDLSSPMQYSTPMPNESRLETSAAAAIRAAGGQTSLARTLGIAQSTVATWLRRGNELPAQYVIAVEKAYGIPRYELRPDIYPPEEHVPASRPHAQQTAAHPSASRQSAPPVVVDVDGPVPALDYPATLAGADPLKGMAA